MKEFGNGVPAIPERVETHILNAARERARQIRQRRIFLRRVLPSFGAAAALAVAAYFLFMPGRAVLPEEPAMKDAELEALVDWSGVERDTYAMAVNLFTNDRAMEDMTTGNAGGLL